MTRIILVGCGSSKQRTPAVAWKLYTGKMFKARLGFARMTRCPWFILSAKYGVVNPSTILAPYNLKLGSSQKAVEAWAQMIRPDLMRILPLYPGEVTLEVHAGENYVRGVEAANVPAHVLYPLRGIGRTGAGPQLEYYANARNGFRS